MAVRGSKLQFLLANLVFALIVSSFVCALAQAGDRTLTLVGIYSQSNVIFELDAASPYYIGANTKANSSINFGALLELPMQGKWGIESGLLFLQRGYEYPNTFNNSITDIYKWKSVYIPFAGRFHPTPLFTGSIGLYLDKALGEISNFSNKTPESIHYRTMKESGYKTLDYGMTYSAGLNIDLNSSTLMLLEIRFNDSWSNLMDTSLPNIDKREKATIHETQLFVGLII